MKSNDCKDVILARNDYCTGCGICQNICPVQAISMEADREGFWYPTIEWDKCVQCGRCVVVCPVLQEETAIPQSTNITTADPPKIYAAWSLNPEIRRESTSGGIFSELASSMLDKGGYLCGAVYDEKQEVRHLVTDKREDIPRLRQSKYVQSDMGTVYGEIANLLLQGEMLLFCGSPCQCAALHHFCRESHVSMEKLYLADFICRGANSPKVYRKFLEELSAEFESDVTRVWFKNKTFGWNRFSTRVEFQDGEYYLKDRYHDPYIRGYIEENLFIRPSCTSCRFKGWNRISDITLGDFWGVELNERQKESDCGTSMVMLHTEKGKELWEAILPHIFKEEKDLESVVRENVCFFDSVQNGVHRDEFMRDLNKMPVLENIERFLK